jgi:hypothetical protein
MARGPSLHNIDHPFSLSLEPGIGGDADHISNVNHPERPLRAGSDHKPDDGIGPANRPVFELTNEVAPGHSFAAALNEVACATDGRSILFKLD